MTLQPGFTVLAFHHVRGASVCSDLSCDEDDLLEVDDPLLMGLSTWSIDRQSQGDSERALFAQPKDAAENEPRRPRLYTCASPDIRPFLDNIERKLSSVFLDKLAQTDESQVGPERNIACETSSMMLISDPLKKSEPDSIQMMSLHKISGVVPPVDADGTSIATSLTSAISSMNQHNSGSSFMLLPPINRRANMHRRVSCNTLPSVDMILSSFSSSRFCLDDLTESSPMGSTTDEPTRPPDDEEPPHLMQYSFSLDSEEEKLLPKPLPLDQMRVVSSSDVSEEQRDAPPPTPLKQHHRNTVHRILI